MHANRRYNLIVVRLTPLAIGSVLLLSVALSRVSNEAKNAADTYPLKRKRPSTRGNHEGRTKRVELEHPQERSSRPNPLERANQLKRATHIGTPAVQPTARPAKQVTVFTPQGEYTFSNLSDAVDFARFGERIVEAGDVDGGVLIITPDGRRLIMMGGLPVSGGDTSSNSPIQGISNITVHNKGE